MCLERFDDQVSELRNKEDKQVSVALPSCCVLILASTKDQLQTCKRNHIVKAQDCNWTSST